MRHIMKATLVACLTSVVLLATSLMATSPAQAVTELPPVTRVTLDNGLQVLLLPDNSNPFVEIHFLARAGSALDPVGKEGVTALMADMLINGTTTRSEDDIAQQVEALGAQLAGYAGLDRVEVAGSVITFDPASLAAFLDIFVDVLRRATFPEEQLRQSKALRLSAIARMADRHSALSDAAMNALLYGDSPRGRMARVTTIPTITREDLVAMRDAVLVPSHGILAIAGQFDAEWMTRWAKARLGDSDWGARACQEEGSNGQCAKLCAGERCFDNPMARAQAAVPTSRRVLLVDREDPSLNQVQFRIAAPNPVTLTASDWGAFRLGTQILGGDFTARLNMTLRVKEGLTYGARFPVSYGKEASGPMRVATYVAPDDLAKALKLSFAEIDGVRAAALPEAEVAGFKAKIINGFPFKFETVSDTLSQYLYLAAEGVAVSWLAGYTDAVAAPTAEQVHAALQKVDPSVMSIVAVGNRDLIPVLVEYGQVTVVDAGAFLESGLKTATAAATPAPAPE